MANTKAQYVREMVLDDCLSGTRSYTLKELIEKCNKVLEDQGFPIVTSKQTIIDDITRIEAQWGLDAIVEKIKNPLDGRQVLYHYKNSNFRIYKTVLTGDDILHLEQMIALLQGFKGLPPIGWLEPIKEKLSKYIPITDGIKSFIELEGSDAPRIEGDNAPKWGDFLRVLANAIYSRIIIELEYRKFGATANLKYRFRPTYLRQFNSRWYLYGFTVGHSNITTIPLDRIQSIHLTNSKFDQITFDYELYFRDAYGATVHHEEGTDVEIVRIQVLTKKQLEYIRTNPLHSTQEIESETDNGGVISLELILNYEFEKLVMSFGEKIKVLEPVDFANRISNRFRQCCLIYND